jgi:Tfp pilus assembly protein PilF
VLPSGHGIRNERAGYRSSKKKIDAEQFENAKSTLKSIIKSDPSEGKAYFLLGNVYLAQKVADSAK